MTFSKGWANFIFDTIKEQVKMLAQAAQRNFAERDARISALITAVELRDKQIERHSEHLQRLQARVEALERFKADKT